MNSLERVKKSLKGEQVDYLPCFPIIIATACQLTGVKQRDYSLDPDIMATTLLKVQEMFNFDGIYVSRDNWIDYESLGGSMIFPEDDEPYGREILLKSISDFKKLTIPNPNIANGMKTVLEAARIVVKKAGSKCYIQANIDVGPFSMAAILRGLQNFLTDLKTENENIIHDFLKFTTKVTVAYGKAMIKTGVNGLQFGDSIASLVSPEMYKEFVLPYQEEVINALSADNCDLWIHICGKTNHILKYLKNLKIQGFEVDTQVKMPEAKRLLSEKIALKGNLDTTLLLRGTPNQVYQETQNIIKSGNFKTGVVISPGCGVPRMTPYTNLEAMVKACKDFKFN